MKNVFTAAISTLLLSGTLAHAGYFCESVPQGAVLMVQEQKDPNPTNTDTEIILQDGPKKINYLGNLQSEGGLFLRKEVIQIYPSETGDTLTIASKPKICGRGSCEIGNDKRFSAILKVENSETFFNCNETPN
ncbi:MAG: hypothetical protein IPK04_08865 [Bdellovibrionales bacterium]|nr:hypothetical protein [Bdellovibrionales bacterium]